MEFPLVRLFLCPFFVLYPFLPRHFLCYFNVTSRSLWSSASVVIQASYLSITVVVLYARIVKPTDGRVTGSVCEGGCAHTAAPKKDALAGLLQCRVTEGVGILGRSQHPWCTKEEAASVLCEAGFGSCAETGKGWKSFPHVTRLPAQQGMHQHQRREGVAGGGWKGGLGGSQRASQPRVKNLALSLCPGKLLKGFMCHCVPGVP